MEGSDDCKEDFSTLLPLAERIHELSKHDDDEVSTVAMGALANIATLDHVCGKWVEATIPTLVNSAKDDLPHRRREAIRAIRSVSTRDKTLAAKLVRAGVMESLELEAAGGASDQSPDIAMQTFAQEAIEACRA